MKRLKIKKKLDSKLLRARKPPPSKMIIARKPTAVIASDSNPLGAGRKEKYTVDQIKRAMWKHHGMITYVADALGTIPQVIAAYKDKYPELVKEQELIFERRLDKVESKLMKAIDNGEAWAIAFFLKCHGKKRGYEEKAVVDHNFSGQVGFYKALPQISDDEFNKIDKAIQKVSTSILKVPGSQKAIDVEYEVIDDSRN